MVCFKSISVACAAVVTLVSPSLANFSGTSPHTVSVGVEGFYYKYHEPGLMEDNGALFGLNGEYSYSFQNNIFVGTEARIDLGSANYKSNGTGRAKSVTHFIFEPRFLAGYDIHFEKITVSPYTGLGFRYKSDYSGGHISTTGHIGYDRHSHYLYLPIGIKMRGDYTETWDWQSHAEVDILLTGRQHSDSIYYSKELRHDQDKGWGLKAEYLLGHKFTNGKLSFGPFFNYWDIDDSEVVAGTLEPDNYTVELGLKAKWTF